MKKVLYAGSFDPMTNGHLDLIVRASSLCDHLVVGVIENKSKIPMFTIEERMEMIRRATSYLGNVTVDSFCGLLADHVNKNGFDAVVRGLRATMDFDYEIQMAQMNARLYNEKVETLFLMTNPVYSFVSSSMVKEVFLLKGDVNGLVPTIVLDCMKQKQKEDGGMIE